MTKNTYKPFGNPWIQLLLGVVCMAAVASMQYGWTQFVDPIDARFHFGRDAIQVAFTIFVALETWLVPVEGYLVDRFGPRPVVLGGAVLVALAWSINSAAHSLPVFYLAAAVGGTGTGAVYGTCVGNALKWFPGRRGLAAGLSAAGFGVGAAFTNAPIAHMIRESGFQHTFLFFGLLQGVIVFVAAWGLRLAPASYLSAAPKRSQSPRSFTPAQVLRNPVFWMLYLMFVLVAAGGLVMTASVASIARDLKVAAVPVRLGGVVMAAGVFALTLQRIFDGFGRPFFGWVSDQIGRENTMAIAFVIGALALFIVSHFGTDATVFVLSTALYFGVFGEIYSLFPAIQGDTFGARYAAANAGMLYTAKGTAALLVPLAIVIAKRHGWSTVFDIAMTLNVLAAVIGVLIVKTMRARHLAGIRATRDEGPAGGAVTALRNSRGD
jgi:MFS transporter, OFA family, oxalate/formate antiporter